MCIYNVEQMCTGVYYFMGPVFVMAEWESSPPLPGSPSHAAARCPTGTCTCMQIWSAMLQALPPCSAWQTWSPIQPPALASLPCLVA